MMAKLAAVQVPLRDLPPRLCSYCGEKMAFVEAPAGRTPPDWSMTRHHILPRRDGGSDQAANIRVICRGCNGLLPFAAECPAFLACARAIGEHYRVRPTVAAIRAGLLIAHHAVKFTRMRMPRSDWASS